MKNILIAFLLMIGSSYSAQNMLITDLMNIYNKENWEDINTVLNKKGWQYFDSDYNADTEINQTSWSFNKNRYDDKAEGWIYYTNYNGTYQNDLKLEVFSKSEYLKVFNSLKSNGFKFVNNEIKDGSVDSKYESSKYVLTITTATRIIDDYSDATAYKYTINLTKKETFDWLKNGPRVSYFEGTETIEIVYALKDGEIEGEVINYHDNGEVKKTGFFKNGKRNGEFVEYDYYGNKTAEYTCINGKEEGKVVFYHENGQIKKTGFFKNGFENGDFVEYDEEGNKTAEYKKVNNKQEGKEVIYYSSGIKARESNYVNDVENGLVKEYDTEGRKEKEFFILNEEINGKYIDFWQNGQPYEISYLKNGILNGISINYNEEGKETKQGNYIDGKKNGKFTYYNENGTIKEEENYINDELNGEYIQYFYDKSNPKILISKTTINLLNNKANGEYKSVLVTDDGEKIIEYWNYENGIKNGRCQEFRNDSLIIGTYINNELDGSFKLYYKALNTIHGSRIPEIDTSKLTLITTGYFNKGKKSGIWNVYDLNEKLIRQKTYLNNKLEGQLIEYVQKFDNLDIESNKYVGKIAFKENYKNGLLNGKKEIFGEYEYFNVICDSVNIVKNNNQDSCLIAKYILKHVEINYKDGELNGDFFQTKNDISIKGNFLNNLKNGKWKYFNKSNELLMEENYIQDKLEGERINYSNNIKVYLGVYKNDELLKFSNYDDKGNINYNLEIKNNTNLYLDFAYGNYMNNQEIITTYRGNKVKMNYSSLIEDNSLSYYNLAFIIDSLIDSKILLKNGPFSYVEKDKINVKGTYEDDYKVGEWKLIYLEKGVIIYKQFLNDNLKTERFESIENNKPFKGIFEVINTDENIREEIKINKGLREGKTKIYDLTTGELIKKVNYKSGKLK